MEELVGNYLNSEEPGTHLKELLEEKIEHLEEHLKGHLEHLEEHLEKNLDHVKQYTTAHFGRFRRSHQWWHREAGPAAVDWTGSRGQVGRLL